MPKSHPPDFHQVIKMRRRTTLTEKQLEEYCEEVDVFTDEYFDQSSEEIEQEQRTTSLTSIFEIVPSRADWNCLFHTSNNLVFGGTRNIKDLREDICNYIILKKEHFIGSWDATIKNHVNNMRRKGVWDTNLEMIVLSEMTSLNISIYT